MKRTFYFLRDSVTGKFYINNTTLFGVLKHANVYHNKGEAKADLRNKTKIWEFAKSSLPTWQTGCPCWARDVTKQVEKRKNLPNWGIEIVEITVNVP